MRAKSSVPNKEAKLLSAIVPAHGDVASGVDTTYFLTARRGLLGRMGIGVCFNLPRWSPAAI